MPFSSKVLMRLASVYLGGGAVKCCSPFVFTLFTVSPFFKGGRKFSPSPSFFFSFDGCMTVKPSKRTWLPLARRVHRPLWRRAVVVCWIWGAIWEAMKRFQMRV